MTLSVDSLLPASLPGGWPTVPTLIVGVPVLLALVALAIVHRRAHRRAHALAHDVERMEPTDPAILRAEGLARFTEPRPPDRSPGSTVDVRARDSLATLVGTRGVGDVASNERRASGTPGWPNLDGVERPSSPPTTVVPERTPDAFSSHPEDRNIHRRRWLQRNRELMSRLDAAHENPRAPMPGEPPAGPSERSHGQRSKRG